MQLGKKGKDWVGPSYSNNRGRRSKSDDHDVQKTAVQLGLDSNTQVAKEIYGVGIRDLSSGIRKKTYSGSRIRVLGKKRHRIPDPDPQDWLDHHIQVP